MTPKERQLTSCVDWFSATFKSAQNWQEIAVILGIERAFFDVTEKGINGYKKCASFGRIQIFFEPHQENMGIWLNMSGQACRDFEDTFTESGYSWLEFFRFVIGFEVNITRLDLAIDDFYGYFNLKQIENCIKRGCVTSLFRTARNFEEHLLSDGSTNGQTIYFGKSEVMVRFYDKYKERINKGYSLNDDINQWIRTELQLRGERATVAVETIVNDGYALGTFICGVLNRYLCFRVPGADSHKDRWNPCRWWLRFLNSVEKISLGKVAPDKSILRSKDWLDNQVVATVATLYEAFGDDNLFVDYLVKTGRAKMSVKQQKMASDFKMDLNKLINLKAEMREAVGSMEIDYVRDVYVDDKTLKLHDELTNYMNALQRKEKVMREEYVKVKNLEKSLLLKEKELNEKML